MEVCSRGLGEIVQSLRMCSAVESARGLDADWDPVSCGKSGAGGGGTEGRAQRSQLENGQPSDNSGGRNVPFLLGGRFTFKISEVSF